ncbi:hypothetical protein ABPG72_011681 [Tetrahymena utriculariae]
MKFILSSSIPNRCKDLKSLNILTTWIAEGTALTQRQANGLIYIQKFQQSASCQMVQKQIKSFWVMSEFEYPVQQTKILQVNNFIDVFCLAGQKQEGSNFFSIVCLKDQILVNGVCSCDLCQNRVKQGDNYVCQKSIRQVEGKCVITCVGGTIQGSTCVCPQGNFLLNQKQNG